MRSKQRIIGLWHDFTCEGWLWDQAFPTLLKHSADLFNLFVDKHVVFRRQSFIECIARFEVKQKTKHSFSHSKTFHLRDVALIIPYFFCFIHFLLESNVLSYHCQQNPPPFEAVLTLLSARPKAAAPSVAHGLRPLVVAFFGGEEKKMPRKTRGEGGTLQDVQKYLGVWKYQCKLVDSLGEATSNLEINWKMLATSVLHTPSHLFFWLQRSPKHLLLCLFQFNSLS